jgi:hypothetical protein
MPFYPPTTGSRLVWGLGLAVLLLSLWLQMRMWLVVFGLMPVAAGGGESMVALFVGLPALAVATVLLGVTALVQMWRSWLALLSFRIALVLCAAWMLLFFAR